MHSVLSISLVALLGLAVRVQADCFVEFWQRDFPQWECDVCGPLLEDYETPIVCLPQNATFDNIALGPINGTYEGLTWHAFDVVAQDTAGGLARQVEPYSQPQYASVAAGTSGVLTGFAGSIYSMYYGCVDAVTGAAAGCEVTVVGICNEDPSGTQSTDTPVTTLLRYTPAAATNASMQYAMDVNDQIYSSSGEYTGKTCSSFTFSAVGLLGAVDLLLDEIYIATMNYNPMF